MPSKAGEFDDFYPPYLLPNSPWLEKWKQRNPYGWKKPAPSAAQVDTQAIHYAALHGDIDRLTHLITEDKGLVNVLDRNGWTCLHEAVRAGQTEAVKILIQNGADINARTHYGTGESVLAVAINNLPKDHPLINYLVVAGAHFIVPEDEL